MFLCQGSEEQKQKYLPGMADYSLVGCWGLTEPSNGSDAAALMTTATKVPGGWKLNGQKRWDWEWHLGGCQRCMGSGH